MFDRPKARTKDVVTERLEDELVVYDTRTQTAHCLSRDAAFVWAQCDGRSSQGQIADRLGISPEAVRRAVAALHDCALLDGGPVVGDGGYSRREAAVRLARAGGTAFAAPLIYSAAVGSAAAAASLVATGCRVSGSQCTTGTACISGSSTEPNALCASGRCYCSTSPGPNTGRCAVGTGCSRDGTACTTGATCCGGVCTSRTCSHPSSC
jgi:hypothetical protein